MKNLDAHSNLVHFPTAGILSKLVHQPPSVNPLEDFSFVVVPMDGRHQFVRFGAVLYACDENGNKLDWQRSRRSSRYLINDAYWPHSATEFLVCHAAVLLLLAPHLSHGLRFEELKNTLAAIFPFHQAVVLLRVNQNISDELPKMSAPRCCRHGNTATRHRELSTRIVCGPKKIKQIWRCDFFLPNHRLTVFTFLWRVKNAGIPADFRRSPPRSFNLRLCFLLLNQRLCRPNKYMFRCRLKKPTGAMEEFEQISRFPPLTWNHRVGELGVRFSTAGLWWAEVGEAKQAAWWNGTS